MILFIKKTLIVLAFVAATIAAVKGLAPSGIFLAKTTETFKLSELQYIEAQLQANERGYTVEKLLVDRATGSTLLRIENLHAEFMIEGQEPARLPSSLKKCDWILEVLTESSSAEQLVGDLREDPKCLGRIADRWKLDYLRFDDHPSKDDEQYTMKTLLCSVAQTIPFPPVMNPKDSKETLLLIACQSERRRSLFFGRMCYSSSIDGVRGGTLSSKLNWSKRPYQYSSAINQKAAEIIIDWLHEAINFKAEGSSPLLLDPTCGSGTFLALAIERGFRVEGYDVNCKCAEGSLRNLKFIFGDQHVEEVARIECKDSAIVQRTEYPDCVVANLPWGVNSIEYLDENLRILQAVQSRLQPGTPCVMVTRKPELEIFQQAGYSILAQACIPPTDFKLPASKKKRSEAQDDQVQGRNQCVVTMVVSA